MFISNQIQKFRQSTLLIFSQNGVRDKASIQFCSALGVIFGVQKYAQELSKICEKRDLNLNFRHNLVKVNAAQRTATFDILNADGISTGETKTMEVYHILGISLDRTNRPYA